MGCRSLALPKNSPDLWSRACRIINLQLAVLRLCLLRDTTLQHCTPLALLGHSSGTPLTLLGVALVPAGPWRCRGATLFEKTRPPFRVRRPPLFGPTAVSPRKTHNLLHVICLTYFWKIRPISGRAFEKRAGALLRSLGLPRTTFKATTQNTAFRRDWRSVGSPFWPKWAWRSRGVHILKTLVFSSF